MQRIWLLKEFETAEERMAWLRARGVRIEERSWCLQRLD